MFFPSTPIRWRHLALCLCLALGLAADLPAQDGGNRMRFTGWARSEAELSLTYAASPEGEALASLLEVPLERLSMYGRSALRLDLRGGNPDSGQAEASGLISLAYRPDGAPRLDYDIYKLFISLHFDSADLMAGRLIANYGKGRVFSPLDIYSDVHPVDFSRSGTELARLVWYLDDFNRIEALATLSKPLEDIGGLLRAQGTIAGWDWGAQALWQGGSPDGSEKPYAGLGAELKGDLFFGLKGEALVRLPVDWQGFTGEAEWELMAGLDWSIGGKLLIDTEYQWSNRGEPHQLFLSLSSPLNPSLSIATHIIAQLEAESLMGIASFRYIIARGSVLDARYVYTQTALLNTHAASLGLQVSF